MAHENDNELVISYEAPLEACPEGKTPMVCVDIFKADPEEQTYDGVTKLYEKVMFVFQAFPEDGSRDSKGKPYQVERKFTWSLDPQSKLRPFLESWRGRDFTEEELRKFDVGKCKGVSAWGYIVHNTRFANIQDIEPYTDDNGKALPAVKAENYTRRTYKKKEKSTATQSQPRPSANSNPYDPIPNSSGQDMKDALPF